MEFFKTAFLRVFTFFKVPLLASVHPKIIVLNDEKGVLEIPLFRKTRNHLNSMYFGALLMGADAAAGFLAYSWVRKIDSNIKIVFKDVHAKFLKRAHGDVWFVCEEGGKIEKAVLRAARSGERVSIPVSVQGVLKGSQEPVAQFKMTLSIKKKSS